MYGPLVLSGRTVARRSLPVLNQVNIIRFQVVFLYLLERAILGGITHIDLNINYYISTE